MTVLEKTKKNEEKRFWGKTNKHLFKFQKIKQFWETQTKQGHAVFSSSTASKSFPWSSLEKIHFSSSCFT